MAKFFLRFLIVLSGLCLLFIFFLLVERIRGQVALSRYEKELRAKGEKLTLDELDLPKAPKEGNGAPSFLQVTDQLLSLTNQCPAVINGVSLMKFVRPGRVKVSRLQNEVQPCDKNIDKNIHWADLANQLRQVGPILNQTKEALQQPTFVMDLDYRKGISLLLPHVSKIRTVTRALAAATLNDLHEEKLDDALKNLEAIAKLSRFSENEPLIISQLVGMAVEYLGVTISWEALQTPGWNDTQLEKLQNIWRPTHRLQDVARSFETERAMTIWTFQTIRKSKNTCIGETSKALRESPEYQLGDRSSWLNSYWMMYLRIFLWHMAWSWHDELHNLRLWQTWIEGARSAVQKESWSSAKSLLNHQDVLHHFYDRCRFIFSTGSPSVGQSVLSVSRFETQREMTVAAIALKRYQLRHHKLPSDLAILLPEFLSKLPHDYINGEPLHYHLDGNGSFALYSVGEDGRDDGGNPNPLPGKTFKNIWDGQDIVWPMPASQEEIAKAETTSTNHR